MRFKLNRFFQLKFSFLIVIFEIVTVVFSLSLLFHMNKLNNEIFEESTNRFLMAQSVDVLRQTSDDLTKFAQSYIITQDLTYKHKYDKTLDIKDGIIPRPYLYENIYWGYNKKIKDKREPDNINQSINDIFNSLPFNEKELALVEKSLAILKEKSEFEKLAFIKLKSNNNQAIQMLYTDTYEKLKIELMNPIDQLLSILNKRTKQKVDNLHNSIIENYYMFITSIIFFVMGNIIIYKYLNLKDKEFQKENQKQQNLLIQQSKLAAMSEMVGNIAHQWKQPLATLSVLNILLYRKFKEKSLDIEFYTQKYEVIKNTIEHMSETINHFMNFYSPSKAKVRFNIHTSIIEVVNLVKDAYASLNIKVEIHSYKEVSILGFKNEFQQVVLNLLNNSKDAIKYNKNDNGKISIKINKFDKRAIVLIQDNGGGIKQDLLDKVFEPYFTTKFKNDGTGIGLYMSKMIIEKHMKGKLDIKNKDNGVLCTIILNIGEN